MVDVAHVDPALRSSASAPVTMPKGPHRYHSSTVSTGSEQVEDRREPLGVEPAVEELDVLGLTGQHVDQVEAAREAVLEVLELLEEHDRARAPVAEEQRHARPGSSSRALVSSESTGVMPEPAAMAT